MVGNRCLFPRISGPGLDSCLAACTADVGKIGHCNALCEGTPGRAMLAGALLLVATASTPTAADPVTLSSVQALWIGLSGGRAVVDLLASPRRSPRRSRD